MATNAQLNQAKMANTKCSQLASQEAKVDYIKEVRFSVHLSGTYLAFTPNQHWLASLSEI